MSSYMESDHHQTIKNRSKSIYVLLLLLVLGFMGAFGWMQYNKLNSQIETLAIALTNTNEQVATTREIISLLAEGNASLRARLKNEETLREETVEAVNEIAAEREELVSQLANLETELSSQIEEASGVNVSEVVGAWSGRVARVECRFLLADNRRAKSTGSAVATFNQDGLTFVTNKHVITGQSNLVPEQCTLTLPETGQVISIPGATATVSPARDLGWLPVPGGSVAGVTNALRECSEAPLIGDELIILGYPSVGSVDSVTATEGIISGFDDGMYVTSAKIERGNSGGAAIHLRSDCFLGIPTLVVVGKIESLARILPL